MNPFSERQLKDVIERLTRLGTVRDRNTERSPREITITDDEAIVIIAALGDAHESV